MSMGIDLSQFLEMKMIITNKELTDICLNLSKANNTLMSLQKSND
jgi:hypothetical protein